MTKALRLNVQSGAAKLKPRRAFAVFAMVEKWTDDATSIITRKTAAKPTPRFSRLNEKPPRLSLQHLVPFSAPRIPPRGAARQGSWRR